jgi:hypothetical protein
LTTLNTSKKEEANRKYDAWKLNLMSKFAYAKLKQRLEILFGSGLGSPERFGCQSI